MTSCCSGVQQFLAHNVILQACTRQCTDCPPRHWGSCGSGSSSLDHWLKVIFLIETILWRKAKGSNSPSPWTLQSSIILHVTAKRSPVFSPQVLGRLLFLTENSWLHASGAKQKDCWQSCPLKRRLTLSHSWFLHTPATWCGVKHSHLGRKKCCKTRISAKILKGAGAAPGPCREIVANAGSSCCGHFGRSLVWFCRNQSWFPSYPSRSGLYHLHSSHYYFLPRQQSCLCLVQRATTPLQLAASCLDTDPKSSSNLQQGLLAGFLVSHLRQQPYCLFPLLHSGESDLAGGYSWDTAETQVQLCHGEGQTCCSSRQKWGGVYSLLSPPPLWCFVLEKTGCPASHGCHPLHTTPTKYCSS